MPCHARNLSAPACCPDTRSTTLLVRAKPPRRPQASRRQRCISRSIVCALPVDLVRSNDHLLRDANAECARRSQVDSKLDDGNDLDGQLGWPSSIEDAVDVAGAEPSDWSEIRAVGEERTLLDPVLPVRLHGELRAGGEADG